MMTMHFSETTDLSIYWSDWVDDIMVRQTPQVCNIFTVTEILLVIYIQSFPLP